MLTYLYVHTSFRSEITVASLNYEKRDWYRSLCLFFSHYLSLKKALSLTRTRASTPLAHTARCYRWDGRKKNQVHEAAPHGMGRVPKRLERVWRIGGAVSAKASAVCRAMETR